MKKKLKKLIIFLAIILIVFGFTITATVLLNLPPKNINSGIFEIKRGETINNIALRLKQNGYIKSRLYFKLLIRLKNLSKNVKSGHYKIDSTYKCSDIINLFVKGSTISIKFTVPEGFTINQVAELLDSKGITNKNDFLINCSNENIIKKYNIPFKNVEGFLFPDTYIISEDYTAKQIIEIMIRRFYNELKRLGYINYTSDDLKRVVIVASLVEKEAKIDSERPIIAAVFYNRLKLGKRLESCATIQYILGKTKERLLYKDLKIKSPYNTYLHRGLPPGPICNPGSKSLEAAINPANVSYLYFVSKHDGTHYFSSSYKEHLEAIKRYNRYNSVGVQSR